MYYKPLISALALLIASAWPLTSHAAFTLSKSYVEAEVAQALEQLGVGDAVTATMTRPAQSTLFQHHGSLSLNIENLDYNARRATWSAEAQALSHGNILRRFAISGSYEMLVKAPTLTQNIKRGVIITEQDITYTHVPNQRINSNTALSAEELIGLAPRRHLTAGRLISRDQLEAPQLIKRGAAIQMLYSTPFMEIKAMGEALEKGAKGQIIRARNIESGLTVRGVVESENQIRISGGGL